MGGVIVGFVLGFMIATSGVSGVVRLLDQGVAAMKTTMDNTEKK
jgi:hypothetical protein